MTQSAASVVMNAKHGHRLSVGYDCIHKTGRDLPPECPELGRDHPSTCGRSTPFWCIAPEINFYRTRTRTGIAGTACRASPRPLKFLGFFVTPVHWGPASKGAGGQFGGHGRARHSFAEISPSESVLTIPVLPVRPAHCTPPWRDPSTCPAAEKLSSTRRRHCHPGPELGTAGRACFEKARASAFNTLSSELASVTACSMVASSSGKTSVRYNSVRSAFRASLPMV